MNLFSFSYRKNESLDEKERLNWLRLIRTERIGPISFYKMLETYGTATRALEAIPEITAKSGKKSRMRIPSDRDIDRELKAIEKYGARLITAADPDYPLPLGAIDDAPPVICVMGDIILAQRNCVGIVGSRNASHNGRNFAKKLARDIGKQDITVASGLARGIDTAAHKGSLETGTIAVVAGGLNHIYPQENTDLFKAIAAQGLVIAENPMGTAPRAQDFPRRNRIVSGLSSGVVVVEANERSGSLITARLAAEQGRDVYAVPGHPLDPRASGTNRLIRDGALLIRSAADVLDDLQNFAGHDLHAPKRNYTIQTGTDHSDTQTDIPQNQNTDTSTPSQPPSPSADTDVKALLLDVLSFTPTAIDELIQTHKITAPAMQIAILELEITGDIERVPGNKIVRIRET